MAPILAVASGAIAVLAVGLAPGLTNLLAAECHALFERTDSIDVSVLLGTGDAHGVAAIRWTMQNLLTDATKKKETKVIDFGPHLGRHRSLPFHFADQHTLPQSIGVGHITTRLALDRGLATATLVALRRWNPSGRVRAWLTGAPFAHLLARVRIGADAWAVKVDPHGYVDRRHRVASGMITGRREAVTTGMVAARVAELAGNGESPAGIHYIDEIFTLAEICGEPETLGCTSKNHR